MTFLSNPEMASSIIQSWESFQKVPNFEAVAGRRIFRKFFELDPRAQTVFFAAGKQQDRQLTLHSKLVIDMLDRVVHTLNNATHLHQIEKELMELGRRHVAYGASPDQFLPMGRALITTMERMLGIGKLTEQDRQNWLALFEFIANKMTAAAQEQ